MAFIAQYPGTCWACDESIEIGQQIESANGDAHEGYQHVVCPEAKEPKPTKFQGTSLDEMGF